MFCAGDTYVIQLTAAPGRSSYRWFRDDVELTSQTTNILTITAPGTYSLAVDNVSGKCPDFSCCPFIVEEDTLPTFQAIAVPVTCVGNAALTNGQIVLSNFRPGYTYQYSFGADFNPAASLSGPAKAIPVGGVIVNNIANPVVAQSYTIRVYNASGCYTDVTVVMLPAICCNVSVVATPGLCAPLTSTYSTTALISLTNPPSGTLTLSDGPKSLTFATTAGSSTTFTATFDNLISDGTSHTVVLSLPGCSTTSTTYTAPASCNIGLGLAITDPGVCLPGTNTYNTTGVISLISAVAGTATITDGASTTTLSINAGATSVPYSLSGLPSGTGLHTVTVNYLGQTASTTYTAPASCSVSPICSISVVATPGLCQIATNTFTTVALINITNPTTGIVTVSDGPASLTFATTAGSSASFTATLANIISDGASHTLTASLPGCSTTTTTYTAPASCSIAPSVCNLSAVATAGLCSTVTHTYSVSVVINLTNAQPGSLIVDVFGAASSSQAVSNGTNSFTLVFDNLIPDGLNRTITVSLPGCGTTTASFTAPVSCSVAPVCSISAVATPGLCSTATNTYSSTVVVSLTNPTTGTLTVTNGGQSQTLVSSQATTSLTTVFDNLISDGSSHTATVSLSGCGTTTATFTAPASCSVAPICSLSAVATAGLCASATNTYSSTVIVTLTNPTAGTLTITHGGQTQTLLTTSATTTLTATFDNLISDGNSHTLTASLPGCSTTTTTYTAPASCSIAPSVCNLSAVATAGLCSTVTHTYSVSVVINLTNAQPGSLIVDVFGAASSSQAVSNGTNSFTLVFDNLIPDGLNRTITVSLPGCGTTTASFTAPVSCSVAPVCSISAVATPGLCSTATNTYSSTVVVSLTNPTTGTLTVTNGGQSQTLVSSQATTSLTTVFDNLISDGSSHTATVSLSGCGTTTATFTAPASCSVAPICSLSAVATAGLCASATNTYSSTVIVTLTNPTAGTLTITHGGQTQTLLTTSATTTLTATFDNLISDGNSHTVLVSLPGCSTTSASYTAPTSCRVELGLAITDPGSACREPIPTTLRGSSV
ncbi:hypothetical protein HMF3257_18990 [Spirosoma telluris]|uniref:Uncharacterized protein n=1 Tax=Spirosoma telluris TaxID=2183553 RepID=A0A327NMV4_9BACT|nr:hypothetical protein HMF3257_18990 [Spirosoma telluris]